MRVDNAEALEQTRQAGRGAILASAHFGNWEVLGSRIARAGYPMWVAVKKQSNRHVDEFVTQARERAGMRVLKTDEGFRRMLRPLRDGEFMTLLFDQDAGRNGVFVDFLAAPLRTDDPM